MTPAMEALRRAWGRMQSNRRLLWWIKLATMAVTIGVIAVLLVRGRQELDQSVNWRALVPALTLGLLLYPLSLVAQAWVWGRMMARMGEMTPSWNDVEIYASTHLLRRLPGAVWYLAGRTAVYRERGVAASVTLAASGLEWALLLAVPVVLYGCTVLTGLWAWAVGVVAWLGLAAGLAWLLGRRHAPRTVPAPQRGPRFVRQWLASLEQAPPPRWTDLLAWTALYALAYGVGAMILLTLTRAVAPQADISALDALQTWALAGGAGWLLSMLIPAGLGINELTLSALLAPQVPLVAALVIATLLRLLFITGDLLWGGSLWGVAHLLARRGGQPGPPAPLTRKE